MVLDGISSQVYPVNAGFPESSILGPTLFPLYINDLPDDVICNISICADDTTLYSKCDQASDLWLDDFNNEKTQLVSFDWSNNTGTIDVKMDGSILEEKSSFKMLVLTFSSKLNWGSYIISITKTDFKQTGALIHSMKFLSPEAALHLYKSTIWPYMDWSGAPSCYLELLVKLQKEIPRTVGPSLTVCHEPLANHQNVASLSLSYRYYFGRCPV